jgi:NTE family protein
MNLTRNLLRLTYRVAIALVLQGATLRAEDRDGSQRPKIGLVLSGGGARGAAHIGVLKALEEMQIPIDYVTGTSMGAVVGALYASGMSPEEIEKWLRTADWSFLLSDVNPRKSESFRSKQREFDLNQNWQLGVSRKGVKIPAGVILGRNLMATFRELTVTARNIHDFDRLPIPFRAVATDIENGDMVVRGDGDLAEAIRASMSVPALFAPVMIDGRLLVDGGAVSNLPVQVAQRMGADRIIAVDVSPKLLKASELNDALLVAEQMVGIMIEKETRKEVARLGADDYYLRLDVQEVGVTEFSRATSTIDKGYEQTKARRNELAKFSTGTGQFQNHLARQRVPRPEGVPISFLEVHTPAGVFNHTLETPLALSTRDPIKFAPLQRTIADLAEMQKYGAADYEVIDKNGAQGLIIVAREKKTGRNVVSLGLDFSYASSGETDANLLLAHRMTELNRLGAEWSTYLSIGDSNRALTEWYQPLDAGRWFFAAPSLFYSNEFTNGIDGTGEPIRFRLQTVGIGLDAGIRLSQVGELRIGLARAVSRSGRRFGDLDDLKGTIDRGWAHFDVAFDTLDSQSFATRGTYGRVSVRASREELGADDNYTRLDGQFYKPLSFGKNTFVPRVRAGLKLGGDDIPTYDRSALGGFLELSGLARGDLYDQNTLLAELIYYRKIADLSTAVGRGLYAGFSAEVGTVGADIRDLTPRNAVWGGSVFLGADTLMGSIHLGVGIAEGGESAVYLQLGPVFHQGQHQR